MKLLQQLNVPSNEYTPIPFWFLNGNLDEKELQRQLEDFAAHGVYGVVLHPTAEKNSIPGGILFLLYSCHSKKSGRIRNEGRIV